MGSYLLESVRLSSRREVAIVLFSCDCSQHIPSRGTTHPIGEQLCLVVADANLSVANSSPYSHSIHLLVRLAETVVGFCRRIQGRASSWLVQEGSQATGESLGSNNRAEFRLVSVCLLNFRFFDLGRLRRPVIRRGSPPGEANGPGG